MLKQLNILLLMLVCSTQLFAASFGTVKLNSFLAEPLSLTVPLMLQDKEVEKLPTVMLASPREYLQLEQTIPRSHSMLDVYVKKNTELNWEITVSSSEVIEESYLVIILKLKQGRGNYFKKIQLFLDPERVASSRSALPVSNKSLVPFDAALDGLKSEPLNQNTNVQVKPNVNLAASQGWSRRSSYGPVQSGDSLSEIAYRLRKDKRWSNQQIMLALFDKNPEAFANEDINNLKKGAFLQVPDSEEVQNFVSSQRYQALRAASVKKVKKVAKQSIPASKQESQPRYRSKVSLGLSESLEVPMTDTLIMGKLERLEPLYQQVMNTDLRIDSIDGKMDNLASEVRILHEKVDALSAASLSAISLSEAKGEAGYGWYWFVLLLIVNFILLLVFLYRRKMSAWQDKLALAQQRNHYTNDEPLLAGEKVMAPDFADNKPHENLNGIDKEDLNESTLGTEDDLAASVDNFKPAMLLDDEIDQVKTQINHVTAFEDAVHKKDSTEAHEHYELMSDEDRRRPRIQALRVEMLHNQGELAQRNNMMLDLFKTHKGEQWHQLCSFFDEDVWSQLLEDNIVNFMGNVIEAEVERFNLKADQQRDEENKPFDLQEEDLTLGKEAEESLDAQQDGSQEIDMYDKTVIMNADDLSKWGTVADTVSDDEDALEVDFDISFMESSDGTGEAEEVLTDIDLDSFSNEKDKESQGSGEKESVKREPLL